MNTRLTNSSLSLSRRQLLLAGIAAVVPLPQTKVPVVNGAEHAWVLNSKYPMTPEMAVCPTNLPNHEYSAEFLLSEMKTYKVDHVVISHVCYYGRDNSYASYCVKKYPGDLPRLACWWGIVSMLPKTGRIRRGWSG